MTKINYKDMEDRIPKEFIEYLEKRKSNTLLKRTVDFILSKIESKIFLYKLESIDGGFSPNEAMKAREFALYCKGKGHIVEIGSFHGRSTYAWSMGLKRNGRKNIKIISVDIQHDEVFYKNMKRFNCSEVVTITKPSLEAVKDWNEPIEILFIDGSHTYKDAKDDFEAWYPYVIKGGVIAFHDSALPSSDEPGATQVVVEEVIKRPDRFAFFGTIDSISYAFKFPSSEEEIL